MADKGVPAALFMALCRTNIRAAAYSRSDPAETLTRVNQLLLSDSRSDMFVTVWYGVWDPKTGEITYSNTGHNPPILVQSTGVCCELTAGGIALGVLEDVTLEARSVTLDPGDVLVAYTDGMTDALRGDEVEFGLSGLQDTVTAAYFQSASTIVERVVDAVDTFTGEEPQFDDLTLVVLKRLLSRDASRSTATLQVAIRRPRRARVGGIRAGIADLSRAEARRVSATYYARRSQMMLIEKAASVVRPRKIGAYLVGDVGAALLTGAEMSTPACVWTLAQALAFAPSTAPLPPW